MATECERFLELASEYIDGTLAPEERVACGSHLELCESCSAYVDTLGEGLRLLQAFSTPPLSDGFHPRLRHRLLHEADREALVHPALSSGGSAAALFSMALLLAVIAWAPVLVSSPGDSGAVPAVAVRASSPPGQLAEGMADRPLFRPVADSRPRVGPADSAAEPDTFWAGSRDLLFRLAPISDRYRDQATPLGFD